MSCFRRLFAKAAEPMVEADASPHPAARGWHGPTPERLELARLVSELRRDDLTFREIADRLGISHSYAGGLASDPTGELARARKDSYEQACVDCGESVSGGEGRKREPRCIRCASMKSAARRKVWTRERIIAAIQWWNDCYGEPPAIYDWNAWGATNDLGDHARALRADRHHKNGQIPVPTTVVCEFGSWNKALVAAGFKPRPANGGGGNQSRRRSLRSGVRA